MRYHDGSEVRLGDLVEVSLQSETARARVVMLGDTYDHLNVDSGFLSWVNSERVLREDSVVVEWVNENPFAHDDPRYAPVGNYMFTRLDEHVHAV